MPQITESFEGLSPSANALALGPGYLAIGVLSPFTFASGLQYVAPVPNVEPAVHEGTLVGDFKLGNPDWGLNNNGSVSAADVPDGSAFIASEAPVGGMTFAFPGPVYAVTAYVTSADSITFTLFDSANNLIYSSTIDSSSSDAWYQNFIFLRSDVPIAKVTVTGSFVVVDKLSFNTDLSLDIFGTKKDDKIDVSNSVGGQPSTGAGSDYVEGRAGDDQLSGGDGSDSLWGGRGNDKIYAGAEDDFISGSKGGDKLYGGDGQDYFFVWEKLSEPVDKFKDFSPSEYDQIVLNSKFYKDLDQGLLSDAEFEEFFDYREKSGVLLYDGDGKGGDRPVHIAMLPKHLDLFAECIYVSP